MPSGLITRLNDTISAGFLAGEINGLTNPYLAVSFQLGSGQAFNFQGVIAEIATNQTPPGVLEFLVFGDEGLSVLPEDNFNTLRNRGANTNSFYFSRTMLDFSEKHFRVSDLFPFRNPRFDPGQYTFFLGVPGVVAADVVVTLTVYGKVGNLSQQPFPYDFR